MRGKVFLLSVVATILWCVFLIGGHNHLLMTNLSFILNAIRLFVIPALFYLLITSEGDGGAGGFNLGLLLVFLFSLSVYNWFEYFGIIDWLNK